MFRRHKGWRGPLRRNLRAEIAWRGFKSSSKFWLLPKCTVQWWSFGFEKGMMYPRRGDFSREKLNGGQRTEDLAVLFYRQQRKSGVFRRTTPPYRTPSPLHRQLILHCLFISLLTLPLSHLCAQALIIDRLDDEVAEALMGFIGEEEHDGVQTFDDVVVGIDQ